MSTAAPALPAARRSLPELARLYYDMTRPRVLALVLFTGLPALALGQPGWPAPARALWVLLGTALSGAACSVLNAWWERETDARMARTRQRPLPSAAVAPNHALGLGLALTVVSTAILGWVGGSLAAAVGLGSIAFYVLVYTAWLKPRTPQNIVIGGAAGATAPLIAEAAVSGRIGVGSLLLFLIIFLWTPPHFWAVALYRKDEYRRAGFPMMPLVVGDQPTRWRMLAYTAILLPVTLAPVVLGHLSWAYGAVALLLGGWFLQANVQALRQRSAAADRRVFRVSILHLSLLFGAMLVDLVAAPLLS